MKIQTIVLLLVTIFLLTSCTAGNNRKDTERKVNTTDVEDYEPTTTVEETTELTTTVEETTETTLQTTSSTSNTDTEKVPTTLLEMIDYASNNIGNVYVDIYTDFYDFFGLKRSNLIYDPKGLYKYYRVDAQSVRFEGKNLHLGWRTELNDNTQEILTSFYLKSDVYADDKAKSEMDELYNMIASIYGEPEVIPHWYVDEPTYIWRIDKTANDGDDLYIALWLYPFDEYTYVDDVEYATHVGQYELIITKIIWP